MYLAGTVVASWSLTQEVVDSSPFTVMTSIFVAKFVEHLGTFMENSNDIFILLLYCIKIQKGFIFLFKCRYLPQRNIYCFRRLILV